MCDIYRIYNNSKLKDTATGEVINKFRIEGEVISERPFGSGHINDTFKITTGTGHNYLLQRINQYVFKDVPGLMNNLVRVTNQLKQKLEDIPGSHPEKETLTLIETIDDKYFTQDEAGNYWRVFVFLSHTKSYDQAETEKQAMEAGRAFGNFQALLSDLDPGELIETIPAFHHIGSRLAALDRAVALDGAHRLNKVQHELDFIDARREAMQQILAMGAGGLLPQRIIHNDTKFNNVLLDDRDRAQCVIDLDTVMPGYVAYDFGDAIRTIINTAPEDEADLALIQLNTPLFTAYVKGYMQKASEFLTDAEVASLVPGVLLLPYMQGVRFLTDYLNGDTYFKINSPWHNLQRAKAQFQLVKKLEEAKETLQNIITKYRSA
jgi:Ser/Thr protein kinase RdoA (MazF antagonist)